MEVLNATVNQMLVLFMFMALVFFLVRKNIIPENSTISMMFYIFL